MDFDKLALNSAIQSLLSDPFNSEAAKVIIQFGETLPPSNRLTIESSTHRTTDRKITGHTEEHGNVTIQQGAKEEQREFSYGRRFERAGYYRIWRQKSKIKKRGRISVICFQYFWKADLTTEGISGSPTTYGVFYDPTTLEYKNLAETVEVTLFSLSWLSLGILKWKSLQDGKEASQGIRLRIAKI